MVDQSKPRTNLLFLTFSWSSFESGTSCTSLQRIEKDRLYVKINSSNVFLLEYSMTVYLIGVSLGEAFVTESPSVMGNKHSLGEGELNMKDESKGSESMLDEGMRGEDPPRDCKFASRSSFLNVR